MTQTEARQKYQFRWTVLGAAVVLLSSASLLQLSSASGSFVGLIVASVLGSGWLAQRHLQQEGGHQGFQAAQRVRLALITILTLVAIASCHADLRLVMIAAGLMLWTAAVSAFLQITARNTPGQIALLVYVQYAGDYLAALFLVISGMNWLLVAGALVFAGSTASVAGQNRSARLVPSVILSAAALFLFAIPPSARLFAIYLTAIVALATWSAHHWLVLADHLRGLTASASDGSTPR